VTSVHPTATESEFGQVARQRGTEDIRGPSAAVGKQSAEHVARRMAGAIRKPAREVWPARALRWAMGLNALVPSVGDALVKRVTGGRERRD
jgi:hypothetical protein